MNYSAIGKFCGPGAQDHGPQLGRSTMDHGRAAHLLECALPSGLGHGARRGNLKRERAKWGTSPRTVDGGGETKRGR
jgi:hypothetical protein